ncbi:hypothetical protein EJ04DRAFT_563183 [Polyplosphaeria fusca]|uniref:Apple domain-containing protein n=1 Tax=Polyplosphaeria fusca TaxID=682080 RepID=A0A9P4QXW8_9PLEO|nr:hypothetical protein EJ04DRAFT_563183 [Polyplosphaeria fusca]
MLPTRLFAFLGAAALVSAQSSTSDPVSSSSCAPMPTGKGPVPSPDSALAFETYAPFASAATGAPIPTGYKQTFKNLQAASTADDYLGYVSMDSYDVSNCTAQCTAKKGCEAVNIYFERDPTLALSPECPNPPSTTFIKCVFWGGPVMKSNTNNNGTTYLTNGFEVIIAGSNGYVNETVKVSQGSRPTCASVLPYASPLIRPFLRVLPAALQLFSFTGAQASTPAPTHPSFVEQPILYPTGDTLITPGSIYTIQWKANTAFSNITLELWDKTSWGYSRDFGELCYHWVNPFCGTIGSHLPNTGSFEWHVPQPGSDFPRGDRVFWIKMYVDDYIKPEIGNNDPVLSYSQNFGFAPEPGQNISATDTSTTTPTPIIESSPSQITVTVYDGPSAQSMGGTPATVSSTATGTPTSVQDHHNTTASPSQGLGYKVGQAFPAAFLLFLALL